LGWLEIRTICWWC